MSAHTPGPWIAERFRHLGWTVRTFQEGMACDFIAEHVRSPDGREGANARLIAAAPDLLAVVEECLESEERRRRELKDGSPASTYSDARLGRIRAAIAKARGGK